MDVKKLPRKRKKDLQAAKRKGKLEIRMITQDGNAKTVGATSYFVSCGKLTNSKKNQLKAAIKEKDTKKIGLRTLQKKINNILGIDLRSHEAARRFAMEFKMYMKMGKA